MGSAGYRIEQGKHSAFISIIKGKTKLILQIRGHSANDVEYKTSRLIDFENINEITKEVIDYYIKDYQLYGNFLRISDYIEYL